MIILLLKKFKIKIGNILLSALQKFANQKEIGSTIKESEDVLLTTVENVTMAKKSYETFYNIIERNFYSYVIWQYWIIS